MRSEQDRREAFLKNRELLRNKHKHSIEEKDPVMETDAGKRKTISLESLQEQLQTLKHEINIETMQDRLRSHEMFFKELGDDRELLFEIIRLYKQKKLMKSKNHA